MVSINNDSDQNLNIKSNSPSSNIPSPSNDIIHSANNSIVDNDNSVSTNNPSNDNTVDASSFAYSQGSIVYQCKDCGKEYKHRNCLVKHRWEHNGAWESTRKSCQTKHQQVQLLEAAQILADFTSINNDDIDDIYLKKMIQENGTNNGNAMNVIINDQDNKSIMRRKKRGSTTIL